MPKGRLHNHGERQHLTAKLEQERLAHSEVRRAAKRDVGRLEREVEGLVQELEGLWEGRRRTSEAKKDPRANPLRHKDS